jgi:superfamily II DNA or RNA helicase
MATNPTKKYNKIKKKSILADVSDRITVKNMKEKGDIYEQYILDYLQSENPKRQCWLWSNIPEEVMCDVGLIGNWNEYRLQRKSIRINKLFDGLDSKPIYGLPENPQFIDGLDSKPVYGLPDVGCDIFMIESHLENNCEYHLIQCKYYAENNSVRLEDLAGWNSMLVDYPEMYGDLYYTSKLSENIKARKPNPRIRYFHKQCELNVIVETNTTPSRKTEPKDVNVNVNVKDTKADTKLDHKPKITFDFILGKHNLDNQFENRIEKDINKFAHYNLKPYNYQLEAYNVLLDKKRTVLQLPCGMGKTLIAIMLSDGEMLIIFISPLKAFCQQNMERFAEQLPEYKCVIVDSEGIRDIDELQTIVSVVGQKTALFATYKSLDVIMQLYDKQLLNNAYFIIDEFHNIPYDDAICYDSDEDEYIDCESVIDDGEIGIDDGESILEDSEIGQDEELNSEEEKLEDIDETDTEIESNLEEENKSPMYRLLHSNARILFMSATPRLFEESDETAEGMDIDNEIFGEVDYSYPMGKAINEGYVCDYMIYVPTMAIPKDTGIDAVIEELAVKDFDKELLIKSRFIIRGCMGTGSRKCIIYCADHKECEEMMKIITELCNSYFAIDCWVDTMTSVDNRVKREAKLKQFKEVRELAFLCSVDI